MEIIGDKEFYLNTKKALRLILKTVPEEFDFVLSFIARIHKNNISFLYPYADVDYFVSDDISKSSVYLYASCILREAYHSYLVLSHIKNNNNGNYGCYNGRENMILSYQFQLKMLNDMNAPKSVIEFVKNELSCKLNNNNKSEIKIVGNREFIDKVKSALLLLKEKDYLNYKIVIQNLGKIVYFPNSTHTYFDRFQDVPTCFMNYGDGISSVEDICGSLVHEACHNKVYVENIFNVDNLEKGCCGYSPEMYCLTKQVDCLRKVGADDELLNKYIYYYDVEWWKEANNVNILEKR